jgi:hypothetical protein
MSYLVAVLIVLAVGLVLSPVLAMRPSARERQVERLRAHALRQGLLLQFSEPGTTGSGVGDRPIAYRLALDPALKLDRRLPLPLVFEREPRASQGWLLRQATESRYALAEAIKGLFETLPDSASRVTVSGQVVEVEWLERGTAEQVERIATVLAAVAELLEARAASPTEPRPLRP